MNDTPIKQLLLSNAYWVINKNVVKAIGLEPAFLLGIFAEAENKLADEEGWFFQTSAKITELTGLTNYKQANAINKLIELNVLLQENRGVPCKRYFKISYENIQKLVFKNFENLSLKNLKTSFQKISNNKEYNYKELSIEEIKEINNIHSFAPNKPKEEKKKQYADDVSLTETEYNSLVEKVGNKQAADECIEILSNYKGATGKKYKSDYKAILNWVIDKWRERHRAEQRGQPQLKNDPVRAAAMVKAMLAEQERRRQNADGYCN